MERQLSASVVDLEEDVVIEQEEGTEEQGQGPVLEGGEEKRAESTILVRMYVWSVVLRV